MSDETPEQIHARMEREHLNPPPRSVIRQRLARWEADPAQALKGFVDGYGAAVERIVEAHPKLNAGATVPRIAGATRTVGGVPLAFDAWEDGTVTLRDGDVEVSPAVARELADELRVLADLTEGESGT